MSIVYDIFHCTLPEKRFSRPAYIFYVERFYDNIASPGVFGRGLV